ncbi:MAG: LD-carboxypeptidase [Oscillospiraceae bacterium]|jgi:muramoyltetrapeptide carboxypeptidase LdcA involved in peptidoglycan recycling|nr:LD-carboxypeptidase [Oscillospiraceae bacterium]
MNLIHPMKLKRGDTVATISLSSGSAGDFLHRYKLGVSRLENDFGLHVVPTPNSLKDSKWIYDNPKARADDLMWAFENKQIKGIISNIGGEESIRILPFINFEIIRKNPKVFMGFSDTTVTHLICLHAGLSTFYGTSVLCEFSENVSIHPYTKMTVEKTLFSDEPIGLINPSFEYASKYVTWADEELTRTQKRIFTPTDGFELLQGKGKASGHLNGGCIEVLEMCKGTEIFPPLEKWDNAILFLETSEEEPSPTYYRRWFRNYGSMGILQKLNGIIIGKPYNNTYYNEYNEILLSVIREETGSNDIPIMCNMNFGHTSPTFIIPYGAHAEINCDHKTFSML